MPLGDRLEALITFPCKAFTLWDTGDRKIDAFKFDRADRKVAELALLPGSWIYIMAILYILFSFCDSSAAYLFQPLELHYATSPDFSKHFYNFFLPPLPFLRRKLLKYYWTMRRTLFFSTRFLYLTAKVITCKLVSQVFPRVDENCNIRLCIDIN